MDSIPLKRCGRCQRELPADTAHFYRQGDKLRGTCKECQGFEFGIKHKRVLQPDDPLLRRCTKCERVLPITEFWKSESPKSRGGRESQCRDCGRERKGATKRPEQPLDPNLRLCTYCWRVLPVDEFYKMPSRSNGVHCYCKKCSNLSRQDSRKKHPEKTREKRREEYSLYHNKFLLYRKQTGYIYKHLRRTRVLSLPSTMTPSDWQRALDYFGNRCAVCGKPQGLWHTLAVDHWIPVSSPNCPGTVPNNIVPLCHGVDGCNNYKGDTLPDEWLISRYGKRKAKQILARIQAYFQSLENQ